MVSWVIESLFVTALLAAIVALICRLFRPRPALCHALWVIVVIKLMTPPWIASPWLPDALEEALVSTGILGAASESLDARSTIDAKQAVAPMLLRLIGNESPVADNALSTQPENLHWTAWATSALLILWAAGALAMAGVQFTRFLRFRKLILAGRDAPEWLVREAEKLSAHFNLPAPRLIVVPGLGSALAWTLGHATILIPEALIGAIPTNRWPTILAHEFAHLKRRDHWTGWLQLLVGCVWWWNPVFWYACHKVQEYAEMACDAWVTTTLPERRHDYAEALIRVVEFASETPSPVPALGMANRPAAAFERRLSMILRGKMKYRLSVVTGGLAALIALLVVPNFSYAIFKMAANPTPVALAVPEPTASPELEKVLGSPVSIEFEDIHMSEIIEFMSDAYDVNIAIDSRVVVPPPRRVPCENKEGEPPSEDAAPNQAPETLPAPTPDAASPDYVTDGLVPYIDVRDVSMREALTALVRPLNLTFIADRDVIWISSPEKIAEDATHPKPPLGFNDEKIMKVLASPASIEFENIHISEILEFISDSWDINIVLDSRVVRPPRKSPSDATVGSTGYVTNGIVSYINLTNIPLDQVLETVLRPLDLTFTVDQGFVWVSSYDLIDAPPLSAETLRAQRNVGNE